MSLGILKRFREKNVQFFFRDFNSGANIQRLLQKKENNEIDVICAGEDLGSNAASHTLGLVELRLHS